MSVRLNVGDAVLVQTSQKQKGIALIKYIGLMMDKLTQYVGLELVQAIPNGHNGTINGCIYFDAKKGHGFHCKVTSIIRKLKTSELIDSLREVLNLLTAKEKYIQKMQLQTLEPIEPSVTHTDVPSYNMPKRSSHSLSSAPISPTGWYNETPIFSVMEKTKTETKEDEILRPIFEPIDSIMTIMSDEETRPRNDSESITDHEFSLSATLSSATIKTPQVTTVSPKTKFLRETFIKEAQKRLLNNMPNNVQPPPRPPRPKMKRPTPRAPPKPINMAQKFQRSVSSVDSKEYNKRKKMLMPKNGTGLFQSSTSFAFEGGRGIHSVSYSDDAVVSKYGNMNYNMMNMKHMPSLSEISNNIIKGK